MTYATITTQLEALLTAAGATMSNPPCTNIVAGEPKTVGSRPLIAYWFEGIRPGAETFTRTQEEWGWKIRIYLPIGVQKSPPRSQSEAWIGTLAAAIRSQLWGHRSASGTVENTDITDAVSSEEDVAGITCRTVEQTWWALMADLTTMAA